MKLTQWGNSKLDFPTFNIPATKEICGRVCKGCYSHKAYKIYPNVLPAQILRYEATLQPTFRSTIRKELSSYRRPFKYFRIHGSAGEFYSQQYINDWAAIASSFPDVTFYAYTKRTSEFDFSKFKSLDNTVLIDSFQYGGLNYGKLEKAPPTAFICPAHDKTVKCGLNCTYCMSKQAESKAPFFKQH